MSAGLIRGNAFQIPLADDSVDLIVTSPPYWALRAYEDEGDQYEGQIGAEPTPQDFLDALWAVTKECQRVIRPSGSIFVNLGDKMAGSGGHHNAAIATPGNKHSKPGAVIVGFAERRNAPSRYNKSAEFETGTVRNKSLMGFPWRYALGCVDGRAGDQLILRAEIVWWKRNGLPESVEDRVARKHEQIFHFTKAGRYYSAIDEIRDEYETLNRKGKRSSYRPGSASGSVDAEGAHQAKSDAGLPLNALGRTPGSVWDMPTEGLVIADSIREAYGLPDHFAAFPAELPRKVILAFSPPGYCLECGEARRPEVEIEDTGIRPGGGHTYQAMREAGAKDTNLGDASPKIRRLVGYLCGCRTPTAPTRPAVVFDPFCGSGTVPMVARGLGRFGVGMDLSASYLRLSRWRVFQSGHVAKAIARTNGERQGSLDFVTT